MSVETKAPGSVIDEVGMLVRDGASFILRREIGGRWRLDLHRVPVDHVEKRVRVTGGVVENGLIEVTGLISV